MASASAEALQQISQLAANNAPMAMPLRIKTPDKPIVPYQDMKDSLAAEGTIQYDEQPLDDPERSVCIYSYEGTKYVLKLGNHAAKDDTTKFKLLLNEDNIYKQIDTFTREEQKHFAKILDAGTDGTDKFYYILMEFIKGKNLYDYVHESIGAKKPRVEVLTILLSLTNALQALWSHGIVHGDLSVENVMIEPNLNVKLIDFEKSSTKIKLSTNTIGSARLNAKRQGDQGIGYFFVAFHLLDTTADEVANMTLLNEIKHIIENCNPPCPNVYAECTALITRALTDATSSTTGGKSRKRRSKKQHTRKARHHFSTFM
jgi:serine/threonine protein kinase